MATHSLPERPSIDRLRRQARDIQRDVRSGILTVPDGGADFPLHLAQLHLARWYGFASWTRLARAVQEITRYRWDPRPDPADPLGVLCTHAVLTFGGADGPDRWARARAVLTANPDLVHDSIAAAAVATNPAALALHLTRDPAAATTPTGSLHWVPLLYLAYSRLRTNVTAVDVDSCLDLLLDAGADPNAGFFRNGLPTPFTALTGVFGGAGAELPRHPHQELFATRLIRAGADPNDGQALYNRMFSPADDHLELLFSLGLGSGDGGVWRDRLPEKTESPQFMLLAQLAWAVMHGMADRIRLLADHGVDIASPIRVARIIGAGESTPLQLAIRSGQQASVEVLRDLGAVDTDDDSLLLEALMSGRDPRDPAAVGRLRQRYPSLILRAAVADRFDAVRLLAALGFDVNAFGRQDIVAEQKWETALHHAAGTGKVELARLLLGLGADPTLHDRRFDSTPLGWAQHMNQPEMAELLLQGAHVPGDDQQ